MFRQLGLLTRLWSMFGILLFFQATGATGKPKVAVIMSRIIPPYQRALEGFKKEFECDTTIFDMQQKRDVEEITKEIKTYKPDLALAIGSNALSLSKRNLSGIPVIFTMVLKPGKLPKNMAGVSMMLSASDHLEGLRLVVPRVRSVGIVYNPSRSTEQVEEFKQAADKLNMKIVVVTVNSKKEALSAIKLLVGRVDAFWMIMDQDVVANFNLLLSLSIKEKVPLATFSYKYVEMGALLALAPKFEDLGQQAGELAKQVLGGTSTERIGVVGPKNYYFSVNQNTALKTGVEITSEVLKKEHKLYK